MKSKRVSDMKNLAYLAVLLGGAITVGITTQALTSGTGEPVESDLGERATVTRSTIHAQSVPTLRNADLVSQGVLASQLRGPFGALGNRLQRPGLERMTIIGIILHGGEAQSAPFILIWELPGRVRFTEQQASGSRVLTFDGQSAKSSNNQLDSRGRRTLELLVFDSVEHFFTAQANGTAATRLLGNRFRLEGDLANPPYDLVEVSEENGFAGETRPVTRTYYFNSDTHLLERLSYRDELNGSGTDVEVTFSDWRVVGQERIPHRIERFENGKPVLTLAIASVGVGPRKDDGAFGLLQ